MATVYQLRNGKQVKKPFNRFWIVLGVFLVITIGLSLFIPIKWRTINLTGLGDMFVDLFTPSHNRTWGDYFAFMLELWNPLVDTLKMSVAGTIIGCLLAVPVAVAAAKNIFKTPIISVPIKFLMNLIRTIPTMVLAILATFVVGLGILSGILALAIFSFGIMAKMLYEAIETVDMSPFEAVEATGANKVVSFRYAVFSQIAPIFISYTIYIFEINIRASAVLGYVGAGGIGQVIKDNVLYHPDRVGATIIVLFVVILIFQFSSNYIRRKLQ